MVAAGRTAAWPFPATTRLGLGFAVPLLSGYDTGYHYQVAHDRSNHYHPFTCRPGGGNAIEIIK